MSRSVMSISASRTVPVAATKLRVKTTIGRMVALPLPALAQFGLHAVVPKKYDAGAGASGDDEGPRGPFDA